MTELRSGTRLQSSLGTNLKRENGNYVINSLIIARVTKINYQYNTIDFMPMVNTTAGHKAAQGGTNAVLPMLSAGRNGYGRAYGETQPIVVGDIVLIGYVEGRNTSPIVIARYPDKSIAREVSTQTSPAYAPDDTDSFSKSHQKIIVRPDLTYDLQGGTGRRELTFSGNTFLLINPDVPQVSHATDDGELPASSKTLNGYMDGNDAYRTPLNRKAPEIIFGHNGTLNDDDTVDNHEFYLYLSQDGTYRTSIMNDQEDWRSYFEQTKDGKIRLRRQEDSKIFGAGANSSEIGIDDNGYVTIRSQTTGFLIKPDGIYNADGTKLDLEVDISGMESNLNTKLDGAIAGIDSKVDANNKVIEVQLGVFKDQIATKVSEDTLVDSISAQLTAYQDSLTKNKALIDQYRSTIATIAEDGHVDSTEMKTVESIWYDLAAAYPILQAQAKKYGVDTTELDSTYKTLSDYIVPIISSSEALIDSADFVSKWGAYLTSDGDVNQAIYDAIVSAIGSTSDKAIQHLETTIKQTSDAITEQAERITKQGDAITKTQGEIKLAADNIKLSLSQTNSYSTVAIHKQMYGLNLGNVNMFAKTTATLNTTLDLTTGNQVTTAGGYTSEYIVIDNTIHYTLSTTETLGNTTLNYAFYDAQKTFITGGTKTSDQDITLAGIIPPDNSAYIVVSVNNDTKVMLERGAIKHTYIQAYEDAATAGDTSALTALVKQENEGANTAYLSAKDDTLNEPPKIAKLIATTPLTTDVLAQLRSYLQNWTSMYTADSNVAEVYGVDITPYKVAYQQLSNYLSGVLSKPDTLDADKFNGLVSAYYSNRETFTNVVLGTTAGNLSIQLSGLADAVKQAKDITTEKLSQIDQTIDHITQTVSDTTTIANNAQDTANAAQKAVNDLSTNTTEKFSKIDQTTDHITQTVSDTTTIANNANNKINNLQVGGTNLLNDTTDYSSWNKGASLSIDTSEYPNIAHYPLTTATNDDFLQKDGLNLEPSTTYTLSFKAKGSGLLTVYVYPNITNGAYYDNAHQYQLTSDDKTYSFSFTTGDEPNDTKHVLFRNLSGALEAYITQVKLEKGNISTAWSPAPEDAHTQIEAVKKATDNADARLTNVENNTTDDAITNAVLNNPLFEEFKDANDSDKQALSTAISALDDANQATIGHLTTVETLATGTKTTVDTLVSVSNDMQTVTTNVQNYMTFDSTGLTIGKSDSPFSINISNKQISFEDSGKIVAYVSGQRMYIGDAKITTGITLGHHRISSYDNYNTGITYAGGDN